MNKCNDFIKIVKKEQKDHNDWFALLEEQEATEENIKKTEQKLKVILPKEYKCVLLNFPVGYFAFTIIYSILDNSDFNLKKLNRELGDFATNYLIFSENQVGDFYGFKIQNKIALSKIWFYDHELDRWIETKYADLYEFIYDIGLKINYKNRPD